MNRCKDCIYCDDESYGKSCLAPPLIWNDIYGFVSQSKEISSVRCDKHCDKFVPNLIAKLF